MRCGWYKLNMTSEECKNGFHGDCSLDDCDCLHHASEIPEPDDDDEELEDIF
jgi:hypothetical protein